MLHPSDSEETIEVVNVQLRMLSHKRLYGVVIVYRIARADELVCPSDVLDDLPIVGQVGELSNICFDGLGEHVSYSM